MSIEVRGLNKTFGAFKAVDNVSFKVGPGELLALLGPSGSGKSTLLRLIAGLETPDSGEVVLTGSAAGDLNARDRNVGFVFQHYALFKHMTVRQNVAFGLKVRNSPASEIKERTEELLGLVQMAGYGDRYPSQLSGGQRQRVAVARALAPRPRVLLLDEPFGALDAKVKAELRDWIRRLHGESGLTTVFVTHDQEEAMEVAKKIIILDKGRVEQEGDPRAVFDRPATQFVADFVGETNCVETETEDDGLAVWGPLRFSVPGVPRGRRVRIYFRPHDVYVTRAKESLQVPAHISQEFFKGAFTELDLDLGEGKHVTAHLPRGLSEASGFAPGETVYAGITGFHVFKLGE
ncbi:MAG: sulfate/molybdate ABC transporter ATP-binding protein [bacterium]